MYSSRCSRKMSLFLYVVAMYAGYRLMYWFMRLYSQSAQLVCMYSFMHALLCYAHEIVSAILYHFKTKAFNYSSRPKLQLLFAKPVLDLINMDE